MTTQPLRYRQVHLDFHTSEHIPDVGADFDPDEFAATLQNAHVDSVTCFARCHHGWIYFDTKVHPERRHPTLRRNLLKEQIEACHARGIRVPIYITVQWDLYTAERHPEWVSLSETGALRGTPPYEPGFYRFLCVNTPYRDFLKEHVREVLTTFPTDGLFFDIVQPLDCSCRACREGMLAEGLEPSLAEHRRQYGRRVINEFKREMTQFVRQYNETCTIFYNAGHISPRHRAAVDAYTHFEIESLPSGGWGYMHFPVTCRYARHLGVEVLGMTGKFHTSWGDFHSFKNEAALQFECFHALALNAKCSIGDQLHPSGRLCTATYDLIGSVYADVERMEPWCRHAVPVTEIGVFTPEEFTEGRQNSPITGATRILQEGAHQFDILDSQSDVSRYRVLILPDEIPLSPSFAAKLRDYLAAGGALLASFESGLNEEKTAFALEALGVRYEGPAPYSPEFIVPTGALGANLPAVEHVLYLRGTQVEALEGAEVLATTTLPYFNRTYKHFCSHRHTPSAGVPGAPAVVRNGNALYFAHPVFTQYHRNAPRWVKRLVLNALNLLLPEPLVRLNAPSSTIATLNEQPRENRWVLHLLHYVPERRGQEFDTIEDVVPIFGIQVSVRVPRAVREVRTAPEGESLSFRQHGDRIDFTLSYLDGHQMIAIVFE